MKRFFLCVPMLLILLCAALACGPAAAERAPLPKLLVFGQHTDKKSNAKTKVSVTRAYPDTANTAVNQAVAAMVDRLAAEAEARLPARARLNALADTGATVRVTGTKTASFLVLAHTAAEQEPVWADFETAVFDLTDGRRLALDDLFDTAADPVISTAVREQLTAYFPDEAPDAATLDALCADIRQAPFTLSPAYLELHYRADALYPGKVTLMHVRIPYRLLTETMTDYARAELDNSRYLLAALTFDDGPGRGVTGSILETLREGCAMGTFFNLGRPMRSAHDYVAWEHDAGHAVESHTYSHTDRQTDKAVMYKERDRFAREQAAIIGIPPAYMRAPGGNDKLYAKYEIGMPIVRWTTLSGDAASDASARRTDFAANMIHTLKESSVILMHNIKWHSVRAASEIMNKLRERGYMLVTVDELFEIRGMPMEDNVVYFGDEADQQE